MLATVADQPVAPAGRPGAGGRRRWPRSKKPSVSAASKRLPAQMRYQPDLAGALTNLSEALAGLGRADDALAANEEGTRILRELVRGRPEAFMPDLASSLNNLALRLGDVGRAEEALAANEETTGIYRELAAARPEAFGPDLAGSLNNLSSGWPIWGGGRRRWPRSRRLSPSAGSWRRAARRRSGLTWPYR